MGISAGYSINQLRDYSSLFTRSQAKQWIKGDFNSIDKKLNRYDRKWIGYKNATYIDYLKHLYKILEANYPNEYIFKNSFLNDWLIDQLGTSQSKVFNEFRVGNAVADLVMFNGNSKVFEIKSELDTSNRLELQLENYKQAFNQIFVVVPESKIYEYEKFDNSIGIITFDSTGTKQFKLYRNAEVNDSIEPGVIMNILHTTEYKSIVKEYFGKLPEMTSFTQFKICKELILQIPLMDLNRLFIKQMKKRIFDPSLSKRNYKEFNQINLSLKLSKKQKEEMILNLKSSIKN